MRFDQRVVSQIPLRELWNDHGIVTTSELRTVDVSDIVELLRLGQVAFVVANIGNPLRWIPVDECYDFFKSEVKKHLANPREDVWFRENFPDEYFYLASEWESPNGVPIVLLVKHH